MGILDQRVVLITGGGRGLGRQHALLMAAEGAHVVVNDLGSAADGSGSDVSAAQAVADEIVAAGGHAVANTDSVTDFDGAKRLVDTAVEAFGDLHVVVNNAGILRDRTLVNMTENEFDDVIAVHLKGTFTVSHHAAVYWRDRHQAGDTATRCIVNTSSAAGLHGNPGQTNYAAAKAGIAAMTIVAAAELKKFGVRVNCIAPIARTRLTEQTPGFSDLMGHSVFDPENISPLVVCLAAADCDFTGQVFSVYGSSVGIYQGWSIAETVESAERWNVADLQAAMGSLPRRVEVTSQFSAFANIAESS